MVSDSEANGSFVTLENRRDFATWVPIRVTWVSDATRVAYPEDRRGATMPPSGIHDD